MQLVHCHINLHSITLSACVYLRMGVSCPWTRTPLKDENASWYRLKFPWNYQKQLPGHLFPHPPLFLTDMCVAWPCGFSLKTSWGCLLISETVLNHSPLLLPLRLARMNMTHISLKHLKLSGINQCIIKLINSSALPKSLWPTVYLYSHLPKRFPLVHLSPLSVHQSHGWCWGDQRRRALTLCNSRDPWTFRRVNSKANAVCQKLKDSKDGTST